MNHATRAASKPIWLPPFNSRPDAEFRLFCFPYAGGDAATIFRKWSQMLPETIEVCAVQLPGKGARIAEPAFSNIGAAAEALSVDLRPYLNKPFAFFGHSLGAKLSFEVARLLNTISGLEPFHLCVSGSSAPRSPNTLRRTYDLPEPEFRDELQKLNGTPPEVLNNAELMKLMLPVLRAEFQASQTYTYVNGPPLACPITIFGGLQDEEVTRDKLQAWQEETTKACSMYMMPGDHFFINTQSAALLQILSARLIDSFLKRPIISKRT